MPYKVEIRDMSSTIVVADLPATALRFNKVLSGPGAANISVPMNDSNATPSNLSVGAREVYIYNAATTRVWGGYLWAAHGNVDQETVDLTCGGFTSRLGKRVITDDLFYNGQEQFDIAWGLINYTQTKTNGNLGFTRSGSEVPSGIKRTRHWCCMDTTIGDAIDELAAADTGFDYEITPTKVWTVYYPSRSGASGKSFDLGAAATTILGLGVDRDANDLVNWVGGLPPDDGNCADCGDKVTSSDSTSQTTYGLIEEVVDLSNIDDASQRQDMADEVIHHRANPRYQLQFDTSDMPWSSYDVGQTVAVTANAGWLQLSAQAMRVISYEVKVTAGAELATLLVDSVTS